MTATLEKIVSLTKRRGFVFQSSEIYGGFAATYDLGPLGALLKKNIEAAWRKWNVDMREDVWEIDGAIFLHPKVWEASGHVGGFSDLLVEDLETNKRYRADHLIEEAGIMENAGALSPEQVDEVIAKHDIKSPEGNKLSQAKKFNLLVKTHLGPVEDETTVAYLKGESCQNIYVDYKLVLDSMHLKLPFGIVQIGKAFRNEITVKSFLFRMREFTQMDLQYFCFPEDSDNLYEFWKTNRQQFYADMMKFDTSHFKMRQHEEDERAFYAKDAWDVEYEFGDLGFKELEGIHHRGSYDLDQHSKFSGKDLSYFDQATGKHFNPYIIECSGGFDRLFLATLFEFYREDEKRVYMAFPPHLAPIKAAVFPLLPNKPELVAKAQEVYQLLRKEVDGKIMWDDRGNIGKRYLSQDEIGTPYCITVDFDSLEDGAVTVRDRDSMSQERVKIDELVAYLKAKLI